MKTIEEMKAEIREMWGVDNPINYWERTPTITNENTLLTHYFTHGDTFMTATEIAAQISLKSGKKVNPILIGKALAAHGFKQIMKKINRQPRRGWLVNAIQ